MSPPQPITYLFSRVILTIMLLWAVPHAHASQGEGWADLLLGVGMKLFPSFLAADQDIVFKSEEDEYLLLLIVHAGHQDGAERAAGYLEEVRTIRTIPVRTLIIDIHDLKSVSHRKIAGILLAQPHDQTFEELVRFSQDHQAILFSPFKDDVERGAFGGMSVTDKVVPLVNMKAMADAGIRLKPFFLKIARKQ